MLHRLRWVTILSLCLVIGYIMLSSFIPDVPGPRLGLYSHRRDDWAGQSVSMQESAGNFRAAPLGMPAHKSFAADTMGFSVGGAKDINNFRENIKNGFMPQSEDLTFEGLFYDYYFDTEGQAKTEDKECTKLFCPTYAVAVSKDPVAKAPVYYMSVGLRSGMQESDFSRKKLNLVIVLDVSGSMSTPFDKYYYDGNRAGNLKDASKSKIQVASESVVALMKHLNIDDRLGMVVFNNEAQTVKPLNLVGETDMDAIKQHIMQIKASGGTNMEAGIKEGTSLFKEFTNIDTDEYENRIIFLTDAQPNTGSTDDSELLNLTASNSLKRIYTTFIGIGVDFNGKLIERITKIRGSNYYSVHNAKEFSERMDEGFDYMVTPLVFDLKLNLQSSGYRIVKVYGSPEADLATGNILTVNTLFPSKTEEGKTKGGIILVQLARSKDHLKDEVIELSVSFKNRKGEADSSKSIVTMPSALEHYDTNGIRKAILLTRYGNLMKHWIQYQSSNTAINQKEFIALEREGIPVIHDLVFSPQSPWERQSTQIAVDLRYCSILSTFLDHFDKELKEIKDETMVKEQQLVAKLRDIACGVAE